ncbi:MAG TPA: DUF5666 domain-containing protein [Candidatus Binatia bacterium]|nr:DUF5666 domain-containing protein [Candidatus Binatia bacterium]
MGTVSRLLLAWAALAGWMLAQQNTSQPAPAQAVTAQNATSPASISVNGAAQPPANHLVDPASSVAAGHPLPEEAIQPLDEASPAGNPAAADADPAVQPIHKSIELANDEDTAMDPASLLPDLPPVPPGAKASLIGGTIDRLDRVRDQLIVRPFGGGKMMIAFDPRTKIYRGTDLVEASALRKGDRVYVDTILDGDMIFAKNIRLKTAGSAGDGQGTVLNYRPGKGELVIRDSLSPQPLRVRVSSQTLIKHGERTSSTGELVPGTLVTVKFAAKENGVDVAREISILAVPGTSFTFAGRVEALDLRLGLLVIASSVDHKTYEIHLDPSLVDVEDMVRPGAEVTAVTNFDGSSYVARRLSVQQPQDAK